MRICLGRSSREGWRVGCTWFSFSCATCLGGGGTTCFPWLEGNEGVLSMDFRRDVGEFITGGEEVSAVEWFEEFWEVRPGVILPHIVVYHLCLSLIIEIGIRILNRTLINLKYWYACIDAFARSFQKESNLWLPSHWGKNLDLLHMQRKFVSFVATKALGWNGVPMCDPSQSGWFLDKPHAQ